MEVVTNKLELASNLAELRTKDCFFETEKMYIEDKNGDTRYTEKAQGIFNEFYDMYLTEIEKVSFEYAINQDDKK